MAGPALIPRARPDIPRNRRPTRPIPTAVRRSPLGSRASRPRPRHTLVPWDRATLRAALTRIEATTGRRWVDAVCRERDFSEHLIDGSHVAGRGDVPCRHVRTTDDLCRTHWGSEGLDAAGVLDLLRGAGPDEVALRIQSFGETPLPEVRRGLDACHAAG